MKLSESKEDENLEKYLHFTASLVCLTRFQGFQFDEVFRGDFEELGKHLERIVGLPPWPDPNKPQQRIAWKSTDTEPTLQIATFIAYPLLEGVVRRKLSQFISLEGKVLKEFAVNTKRDKRQTNGFKPGYQQKTKCTVRYSPKERKKINRIDDELRLLEQEAKNIDLKLMLSDIDESGKLDEIVDWRWQLLHGILSSSWHSITLLLVTYIILLLDY